MNGCGFEALTLKIISLLVQYFLLWLFSILSIGSMPSDMYYCVHKNIGAYGLICP